ncbi:MAG: hypothetical protein NVSMB9_31210 [Isosphaeraceae bacterium]
MRITRRRSLGVAIGLTAVATCHGVVPCRADPPGRTAASQEQPGSGALTITVSSSATDPASRALLTSLRAHPWFASNEGRVRLVDVGAGTQPEGRGGGLSLHVYRQGPRGSRLLGSRSSFAGASEAVQWIAALDQRPENATPLLDSTLSRVNWEKGYPSQQTPTPTPTPVTTPQAFPSPPSLVSQPPVQQLMVPQQVAVPQQTMQTVTLAAPASAPANVVQAPTQNYIIQQPQPQFFFAQQAQGMAPVSLAPSNLFMPASVAPASTPVAVQMAPASAAPMNLVPVSMASLPAPAPTAVASVPAAVGPVVSGAAVATQSVSVAASSTRSRIRVRGPGPLASLAARFGERLTTLGRTRIETIQETNLETQTSQAPPGQLVTLSSTSASPVLAPQQNISIPTPVTAVPPPPPPGPTPQEPTPSPQAPEKHHWRLRKN